MYNNSTGMISLQYYVGFYCENTQIILIIFQNKTYTFKLCLFYLIFATYIRTTKMVLDLVITFRCNTYLWNDQW